MTDPINQAAVSSDQEAAAIRHQVVNRLKRAQGQLGAVLRAIESDADCRDVVIQLAAVSAAVDRAGFAIVASGLKRCLAGPEAESAEGGLTVADFEKLFMMLA
ncbi:MAG: metal-sensitive transcriptional regulator [Bifidobacteriaceae bacterium]|jgi:DNA-binding FrmR family transcriptional regulator|nr:metal-sensitive transcriptional regulator [Bifidobacteriaceae bacterium]